MVQFKDKFSSDFDIIVVSIGNRQRAEEQIDVYEIPYRNDELIIHSGKYKPYFRQFKFIAKNKALIPYINQWLTGSGKLIIEPDNNFYTQNGFYKATVIEGFEYELYTNKMYQFNVKFKVDPFYYYDNGNMVRTITKPTKIMNCGTIYSEPYIKINATGDVILFINDQIYNFTNIDGYIEVDSALMTVYKDTINQGEKMIGDFPIFNSGINNITWEGNVSSIQYKGRWREL